MPDAGLLRVSGLRAGYGLVPVLLGVGLEVGAGEIVGILGHNGMGKTTLMKALVGLVAATDGYIVLAGEDVTRQPAHRRVRRGIGYVPQGREIFAKLTARENLVFAARAAGVSPVAAVDAAVADFPALAECLERKGGALSGGQQQILALARALCGKPRLLLLDEPTEGIQPSVVEVMEEHLARLAARGLAIVVVEQDLDFIATLARRVLLLQKGEIVRVLAPQALHEPAFLDDFMGLESSPGARPQPPAP